MEKPDPWFDIVKYRGYSVVKIGRVRIPASIFVGSWIIAAITTIVIAVVTSFNGPEHTNWVPAAWFFGGSLAVFILLILALVIVLAVDAIIEVNKREESEDGQA